MTVFLGWVLMNIPNARRRLLLSNLGMYFLIGTMIKFLAWQKNRRQECSRWVSFPFLIHLCRTNIVGILFFTMSKQRKLEELRNTGRPVLFLVPHTCLFESLATSPLFRPFVERSLGAIYRPNKNPALDAWITAARQNVGIKTFSRKEE